MITPHECSLSRVKEESYFLGSCHWFFLSFGELGGVEVEIRRAGKGGAWPWMIP